jgi:thiol-disulfide isomerase/thioredoxin
MKHQSDVDERFVEDLLASLTPARDWTPDAAGALPAMHAQRAAHRRARGLVTALVLATGIVFVSVPVLRAFGARCLDACVNATSRVAPFWNPQERMANTPRFVGASIGDLAPDMAGHDRTGRPVSLSALRGHVVIVNFWATWCAPCRAEMPLLDDLQDRYGPLGLQVLGVSLDEGGWTAIDPFLAAAPVRYPIALGNDEISAAYGGVTELPATVAIDANGVIVARMKGALQEGHHNDLDRTIAALIGGGR